ncbi:hypothetical protein ACFL37_01195 [Candidatus Margulisiibacteriota bacterium]
MSERELAPKPLKKTKVTPEDKAREIVEKCGNNFHAEVIRFLRGQGWEVLISPYYNDNVTDKPREIDIIAEKAFNVMGFRNEIGTLNVKLLIECKFINREIVFWFDQKDQGATVEMIEEYTPLKVASSSRINEHHYYAENKVAKLFASGADKSQQNELFYQALNQSLNAMVYFRSTLSIIPEDRSAKVIETVNYPIILCNNFDKMYKVDMNDAETKIYQLDNDFMFEVNFAYLDVEKRRKNEYFLIDVVNFGNFAIFLERLSKSDLNVLCDQLSINHRTKRMDRGDDLCLD